MLAERFRRFAHHVSNIVGSPATFIGAVVLIVRVGRDEPDGAADVDDVRRYDVAACCTRNRTGRSIPGNSAEGVSSSPSFTPGGIASQALYSSFVVRVAPQRVQGAVGAGPQ